MATLSSCLIWQVISFSLPPNEYGCVYAWTTLGNGPAIDLQKMAIHQNQLFWSWRVCKQAKLSHLGHRKPARIHWKANIPKTSHCLVWIASKVSKERPLQSMAIVIGSCWTNFWQHLVSTGRRYVPHSRSYTRYLAPCFWRSHYQPQSWCRLANSELRFDTVGLVFVGCPQR